MSWDLEVQKEHRRWQVLPVPEALREGGHLGEEAKDQQN